MRIALIDNYDSFTYNLVHLVRSLGTDVDVIKNDRFRLGDLAAYDKILLSPGPGLPSEAGLLLDVIKEYAGKKPILGVCLGHQAIAETFGARLKNLEKVVHGISSPCRTTADDMLFRGLPAEFRVGRYHSWVVVKENLPDCLEVTAMSDDGEIMSIRHREYDVCGIQFHPESVLTPTGGEIMKNWLDA